MFRACGRDQGFPIALDLRIPYYYVEFMRMLFRAVDLRIPYYYVEFMRILLAPWTFGSLSVREHTRLNLAIVFD